MLDPMQWPILGPLEHECCLPHYRTRQSTRSILCAANNSLLRVTTNIHTADTIQSSLCAGSCNNHCASEECCSACTVRLSHPADRTVDPFTHGHHGIKSWELSEGNRNCAAVKKPAMRFSEDAKGYSNGWWEIQIQYWRSSLENFKLMVPCIIIQN